MLESQRLEGGIAYPAIRFEGGTGCYNIDNEAGQVGSRNSGDMAQTNSSEPLLSHFYRDGYDRLGDRVSTMTTGHQSPKIAFTHIHKVNQSVGISRRRKSSDRQSGFNPCPFSLNHYTFPCGQAEERTREIVAVSIPNQVFDALPNRAMKAQVMKLGQVGPKAPVLRGAEFRKQKGEGCALCQGCSNRTGSQDRR